MIRRRLTEWRADERGVAAIEAAFVCTLLGAAVMNVTEVCRYAYMSTQVAAATQAAVQAAVIVCDPSKTPVTINCPAVSEAMATALHGSSLGSGINLKEGSTTEAWYCVSSTGGLQQVADAGNQPQNCGADRPTEKPGLYLQIATTYAYEPIFPGLTLAETFSNTIEGKAWMRTQ